MSHGQLLRMLAVGSVIWPLGAAQPACAQGDENVRPAYCAGNWYPGDRETLAREVDRLLAAAPAVRISGKPIALISPHAGYRYSAPVAAAAYATLRGHAYQRVIVLAFSHRYAGSYSGVDVPRELTAYATPLGQVPIDREACGRLLAATPFSAHPDIDRGEHSLELQLPFLQRVLGEFKLVPLLVGQLSDAECTAAARTLLPLLDEQTLLVASSDFTHFGPGFRYQPFRDNVAENLRKLAEQAAAPLRRCDYDGFVAHLESTGDTICGRGPIRLLLRALSMQGGADGARAAFDTSGRITGDWRTSVTYQSFVYVRRPQRLSPADRTAALRLARQTVTAFLDGGKRPDLDAEQLPAALRADGACFVTLENHGRLRGCIGNMEARGPLYQAIVNNAIAACQDFRFINNPITRDELDELTIEISYLTPMCRVRDPNEIVVGRHGLLISLGRRRGVLLPQVAYERGWTRRQFLAETCRKAGLPPDAWQRPEAEIYSFEAEVFGEPEE